MANVENADNSGGRPSLSHSAIASLLHHHFGLETATQTTVSTVGATSGAPALAMTPLDSYDDQNVLVRVTNPDRRVVVKIYNNHALGPHGATVLRLQDEVLNVLATTSIPAPQRIKPIDPNVTLVQLQDTKHFVRVLAFLPGTILTTIRQPSTPLLTNIGKGLARLDQALATLPDATKAKAQQRDLDWDLAHCQRALDKVLHAIPDPKRQALITLWRKYHTKHVQPKLNTLPKGLIHGDANDANIVTDGTDVTGWIDFGDMVYTHRVNDIAICVGYMMLGKANPLEAAATVVRGYTQHVALTPAECHLILPLAMMRLCVSVCFSAFAYSKEPDNQYLLLTATPGWTVLETMQRVHGTPAGVHDAFTKALMDK